jgi:hypothetical protein
MTWVLIKLGIRLVVFLAVFWIATLRNPKIVVQPRWALPLVAGLFALLNTGLYWLLKPVLNVASFGAIWFLMPLVLNLCFLVATLRVFQKRDLAPVVKMAKDAPAPRPSRRPSLSINGITATIYMAVLLTAAHGLLWFALDYMPVKMA